MAIGLFSQMDLSKSVIKPSKPLFRSTYFSFMKICHVVFELSLPQENFESFPLGGLICSDLYLT